MKTGRLPLITRGRPWGIATLALAAVVAFGGDLLRAQTASHLSDQLLVSLQADLSESGWRALQNTLGFHEAGEIAAIGVRVIRVPADRRGTVLRALNRNPLIEFAEPDYAASLLLYPDDPRYPDQWHLPKIAVPTAWDTTPGRADQVIAILDTGVRTDHADLKGKVLPGYNFISNNTNAGDDHGHGTMVAGVAAAVGNNTEGVAGIAWKNWILPVKVLDSSGSGSHSTIANGITYSADNGARIVNLSLGSTSGSRTLQRAVDYAWKKNCLLIAAAGNTGDNRKIYPAAYSNVLGISASDQNDKLASFATYGDHVSLTAPGVSIWSTHRNGSYSAWSGSSFSSPIVAGTAGLVLAVTPSLGNSEVADLLQTTADDLGPAGYDIYFGHGRVNAAAAVAAGVGQDPSDVTPPAVSIVSPADGSEVSATVEVQVDSYDDVGVKTVELYVNGALFAESSDQLTSFAWDTTTYADGDHILEAKARDAAGNEGTSSPIGVTVANGSGGEEPAALSVTILSPEDGQRVSRMTKIHVEAGGGNGLRLIELYINGSLFGTATSSPTQFNWNANREAPGDYKLQAFAYDESGAVAESAVITVVK